MCFLHNAVSIDVHFINNEREYEQILISYLFTSVLIISFWVYDNSWPNLCFLSRLFVLVICFVVISGRGSRRCILMCSDKELILPDAHWRPFCKDEARAKMYQAMERGRQDCAAVAALC